MGGHSSVLRLCAAPGCGPRVIIGRGLCAKHYQQYRCQGTLKDFPLSTLQPGTILTEKTCKKCKVQLPIESFSINGTERYQSRRHSICKKCHSVSGRQQTVKRLSTTDGRSTDLLSNARIRAKAKGLICTLNEEWVRSRLIAGCELTGLPFDLESGKRRGRFNPYGPSIDRIVAGSHYTPENCRMVIMAINVAMNSWGEEFYRKIASAHFRHRKKLKQKTKVNLNGDLPLHDNQIDLIRTH